MQSLHSPEYTNFINALITARKQAGLTQLHVAQRLKRPQSFVSKYESSERRLDVVEFFQICKAMKADALEILKNAGLLK